MASLIQCLGTKKNIYHYLSSTGTYQKFYSYAMRLNAMGDGILTGPGESRSSQSQSQALSVIELKNSFKM